MLSTSSAGRDVPLGRAASVVLPTTVGMAARWPRVGGLRGSWFLKRWEGMGVAEYYLVGDRDRRFALETLLDRFDSFDDYRLRWEIQIAHCRIDDPLSPAEARVAAEVNEALDRASLSQIRGEPEAARAEIAEALARSRRLKLSLDDVLDRVVFRPARRQEPERYRLLGQRSTRGGRAAGGRGGFHASISRTPVLGA